MKSDATIKQEIKRIRQTNLPITIKDKNKSAEIWLRGYLKALEFVLENESRRT